MSLTTLIVRAPSLRLGELGVVVLLVGQLLVPFAYAYAPDALWFLVIAPRVLVPVDALVALVAGTRALLVFSGGERAPALRVLQLGLAIVDVGVLGMFGSGVGVLG